MGLYVHPASAAEDHGRNIELLDTWEETRAQLRTGEDVCAVAMRGHGKVALVVLHEGDHRVILASPPEALYAVPKSVTKSAS